jgi:hypothetical protein
MITQERLHELFEYREDGNLIWKKITSYRVKLGDVAGSLEPIYGYRILMIDNKFYRLHRMIFLYHHGYLTDGLQIDHIDGNPGNNRIENLREATRSQNMQNGKIHSDSKSGVKGVSWDKKNRKWKTQINVAGKPIFLGLYNILEEAEAVVKEAREKYHGEYARHE